MAHLIKIGNSQGIRIPQSLIKQAQLQNTEFEIQVVDNGLLITPIKKQEKVGKSSLKALQFLKLTKILMNPTGILIIVKSLPLEKPGNGS